MKLCGLNEFCKDHCIGELEKEEFIKFLREYEHSFNFGDGYLQRDTYWLSWYQKFLIKE